MTPAQKKLVRYVCLADAVIALVLLGLSLTGLSTLPIWLPLLLLVSAGGLLWAIR